MPSESGVWMGLTGMNGEARSAQTTARVSAHGPTHEATQRTEAVKRNWARMTASFVQSASPTGKAQIVRGEATAG